MKNLKICVLAVLVFVTATLASLNATIISEPTTTTATTKMDKKAQAEILTARLHEIKAMDKSDMSAFEKKELRQETRAIKSQLRTISGGVYISAGAAILVALLLILLL